MCGFNTILRQRELSKKPPLFDALARSLSIFLMEFKNVLSLCPSPPLVFCSDLPWYKVFYRALDKISDLTLDHQVEVVEPFLSGLFEHPMPNPGVDTILSVVPNGVDAGQVYSFPLPNPRKLAEIPTDVSHVLFIDCLSRPQSCSVNFDLVNKQQRQTKMKCMLLY